MTKTAKKTARPFSALGLDKGDSSLHSNARKKNFIPSKAEEIYRLAESCRDSGKLAKALPLLEAALRLKIGGQQRNSALLLTGLHSKALEELQGLLDGNIAGEKLFYLANPWMNIYDVAFLKKHLEALRALRAGGIAEKIRRLYVFVLENRVFSLKNAGGRAPEPPALRLKSGLCMLLLPVGDALLERGRALEALPLFRRVERAFPLNEYACGRLGEALLCSGKAGEAFCFLSKKEKVLASPGFYAWHAQLLLFAGHYRRAFVRLDAAAGNQLAWCWRGAARFKLGLLAPALEDLNKAVEAAPGDLEARIWRAELLRSTGKPEAALADLNFVLDKMPQNIWALANKALLGSGAGAGSAKKLKRLLPGLKPEGEAGIKALLDKARGVRRHEANFIKFAAGRVKAA
jgi:tetratricopeptide (TPR) repeat protein